MGGRKRLTRDPIPENQIDRDLLGFISDELECETEQENPFPFSGVITEGHEHIHAAWKRLRGAIITNWISAKPCTRPSLWWQLDAPRPANHEDHETQRQHLESEAHFLKRHGLLLRSERYYLGRHPELLEPVKPTPTDRYGHELKEDNNEI